MKFKRQSGQNLIFVSYDHTDLDFITHLKEQSLQSIFILFIFLNFIYRKQSDEVLKRFGLAEYVDQK